MPPIEVKDIEVSSSMTAEEKEAIWAEASAALNEVIGKVYDKNLGPNRHRVRYCMDGATMIACACAAAIGVLRGGVISRGTTEEAEAAFTEVFDTAIRSHVQDAYLDERKRLADLMANKPDAS